MCALFWHKGFVPWYIWLLSSTDRVPLSEGVDEGSIPSGVTMSQQTALQEKVDRESRPFFFKKFKKPLDKKQIRW